MKKILILLTVIFIVSCSNRNNEEFETELTNTKSTESCVSENPDFQRYFSISKELLANIAESNMTKEEIASFLTNSNYDSIFSRINASTSDIQRYDSVAIYAQRVSDYYLTEVVVGDCSLCSLSQQELAVEFVSIIGWIRSEPDDFNDFFVPCSSGSGTTCAWVQYMACIGACCLLPPGLNVMCVVACYCEFCTRESGHPMNVPCGQSSTK